MTLDWLPPTIPPHPSFWKLGMKSIFPCAVQFFMKPPFFEVIPPVAYPPTDVILIFALQSVMVGIV